MGAGEKNNFWLILITLAVILFVASVISPPRARFSPEEPVIINPEDDIPGGGDLVMPGEEGMIAPEGGNYFVAENLEPAFTEDMQFVGWHLIDGDINSPEPAQYQFTRVQGGNTVGSESYSAEELPPMNDVEFVTIILIEEGDDGTITIRVM